MQADGDDGGDRADREDGREQAGDDDLGEGAQQFHEALDDQTQQPDGGVRLRAAMKQNGTAKTKPMKVETRATLIVMSISSKYSGM